MANRIHDAFEHIVASETQKSSTKIFLQAERTKRTHTEKKAMWKMNLAVVCSILVVLIGVGGYSVFHTPVSYISIDVNPSIELTLNRFYRVIQVTAYNEDGDMVLDRISVKGKLYTDAIDMIVESNTMQSYLIADSDLTFTVATTNDQYKTTLLNGIENTHSYQAHDGESATTDEKTIAEAHNHCLSFGKYAAYLILSEYDNTITVNDCHHMSMSEIHHLIEEHESKEHSGMNEKESECDCNDDEEAHEHHHE